MRRFRLPFALSGVAAWPARVASRDAHTAPSELRGGGVRLRLATGVNGCWARRTGVLILTLLLAAAVAPLVRATHDAPTNVRAGLFGTTPYVQWTAPVDNAQDSYKIQWKRATQSWCDPTDATCGTQEKTAASTATIQAFNLTDFTEGALHTIRVGAVKEDGNGNVDHVTWSAELEHLHPYKCTSLDTALSYYFNRSYRVDKLVEDCTVLLNLMSTLDPDGILNWSRNLSMRSWDGISAIAYRSDNNITYYYVAWLELVGKARIPDGEGGNLACATRTIGGTRTQLSASLTGTVPAALKDLYYPTIINLCAHELTGGIPVELTTLSQLSQLSLKYNKLSGTIPPELGQMALLVDLGLAGNQLTGTIPAELGDLVSRWVGIDLGHNQLSGDIPVGLVRIRLQALDLGNNPGLRANLSADITITENNQTITTSLGKELGKQTELLRLDLHAVNLSGEIPAELADLGAAVGFHFDGIEVILSCNQLTGTAPVELADIQSAYTNPNDSTDFTKLTKLGLNGNPGLTIPAALQTQAATQLTAGQVTCPSAGPPSGPGKAPARPRARLTASLSATPDPVRVGESVAYTLTVANAGTGALSGVFWRSPELGVAQRAIGDGALAPGAAVEATFSFGPVTAQHLPGPIIVNVFADSDQTNEAQAGLAVAVQPAVPTPAPAPAPTPPPGETDATPDAATDAATDAASTAASAPPDPHPAVSDLDLFIVRAFYSTPDPPDPDLGHNILALQLALPDGTSVTCDFLAHYLRTGGLARWGYATSEILEERPNALTQYYQRGAVDCHFRDGRWRVERRLTWDFIGGGVFGAPDLGFEPHLLSDQPGIFPGPWGHRVSNFAIDGTYTGFLNFFLHYGGVPAFGYPKTEARYDDDPAATLALAGAETGVIRQYFQAAVFEHHPDDPDAPVQLGLAGDVLRDLLYPNQTHQRFASFRPAPILTSGEGYVAERVIWDEAEPAS